MRFEDFVLQLETGSKGDFRARVIKSPEGEGSVEFSLPRFAGGAPAAHEESGTSRDIGHQGTGATRNRPPPLEIGKELFRAVFQGKVRSLLHKSLGRLDSQGLGLRLKIKLDLNDEATGSLADLPWEMLCDDETEDFFGLSRQTSLVRYLDVPFPSQPIPLTGPLRILAVAASPPGGQPLDLEEEARGIEKLKQKSFRFKVKSLPHASAGAVGEALAGDAYHVLHFMGHGAFDQRSGEGMLIFEGAGGSPDPVSGRDLATQLKGLRSLGVVVLNACNTARAGANPFRGVATALVHGGIPAVVAMQQPIPDRAAVAFSTAFYRHLARSKSIDEALTEGRRAIHSVSRKTLEWATPALFLRIPEGNVFVPKPRRGLLPPLIFIAIFSALLGSNTIGKNSRTWQARNSSVASSPKPILTIRSPEENETVRLAGRGKLEVRGEITGVLASDEMRPARSVHLVVRDSQGNVLGSDRSPVTENMSWRISLIPAVTYSHTTATLTLNLEGTDRHVLATRVRNINLIKED